MSGLSDIVPMLAITRPEGGHRLPAYSGMCSLGLSCDGLHAAGRSPLRYAVGPRLVEVRGRRGISLPACGAGRRSPRAVVGHVHAVGRHHLGSGIVEADRQRLLLLDGVDQQDDGQIALDEGALSQRDIGVAALDGREIERRQVIAAGDEFVAIGARSACPDLRRPARRGRSARRRRDWRRRAAPSDCSCRPR